jgi:glycosyltransferase involved in cell wall biosynthesis
MGLRDKPDDTMGNPEPARSPSLSLVVVVYNIPREAPRTLYSLSAAYQREISRDEYEVIVVDNGSTPPLDPDLVRQLDGHFRLIRIDDARPSPAAAVNRGLAAARGDVIGVMIDGARIATPGLLHFAARAASLDADAVIATPGWYLGPTFQRRAVKRGYTRAREDALLASIGWPDDGYRLFEIGALDESSGSGWGGTIAETNALFMRRHRWATLGGVDEAFDSPGGGLANLDLFNRAVESPEARLILLFGEGTFHQLHGGVATNEPLKSHRKHFALWKLEYERIRGKPYATPKPARPPICFGQLPQAAARRYARNTVVPMWMSPVRRAWGSVPVPWRVKTYLYAAHAWNRVGLRAQAMRACQRALALDPKSAEAALRLAALRMPGDSYVVWLSRLYRALTPATAIEIGVFQGSTLALFQPPTLAIGVDPQPDVRVPLGATTRIARMTSDEFFQGTAAQDALGGRPLSIGFIDGLHTFEQALRDFRNLEARCHAQSVILIHDTIPLSEATQQAAAVTRFHTGDVWKLVPCLKHYRPDLDVFTIPAPPTGLTVVVGLDPSSRVLLDRYDEAVDRFGGAPYADMVTRQATELNVVTHDWEGVRSRLAARGITLAPW